MRREVDASSNIFPRVLKYSISNISLRDNYHHSMYRSKIEQTMNLTPKAISISKLLSQILSDAVIFDKERHSKLIELCKNILF